MVQKVVEPSLWARIHGLIHPECRFMQYWTLKKRRDFFEEMFNDQIDTLWSKGCRDDIIDMLRTQKKDVINKALATRINNGNLPFLPVIPLRMVGLSSLIRMARGFGGEATLQWDDQFHSVGGEEMNAPYYIFDVDTVGVDGVEDVESGYLPLRLDEALAMCTYIEEVSGNIAASGTIYGDSQQVVIVIGRGCVSSILTASGEYWTETYRAFPISKGKTPSCRLRGV